MIIAISDRRFYPNLWWLVAICNLNSCHGSLARVLGGVHIELDGWGVQIEAGHGLELVAVHVKEGLVSWPWWWSKQAPRGPLDIWQEICQATGVTGLLRHRAENVLVPVQVVFRYGGLAWLTTGWLDTRPGKLTKSYGKSQFFMGKLTINGHFQ